MNKNNMKLFLIMILFLLMVFATPKSEFSLEMHANNLNQLNKINSPTVNLFNVTQQDDLIYNIKTLDYNGSTSMNVNDSYNQPAGQLVQGNNIAFNFQSSGNNGTYDYVYGNIRSASLTSNIQDQYFFVEPANITSIHMGPPMLYFVIPINLNFTSVVANLTNAGFTVSYSNYSLDVSLNYYSQTSPFSKVGSPTVLNNAYLHAKWDTLTGIMQYYLFNYTGSPTSTLELSFLTDVNIGSLNPNFGFVDASLFYNIATLNVNGTSTQLIMNNHNDPMSYGFIAQGQNALVHISPQLTSNGPSYHGDIHTVTGGSSIMSPFGNNGSNNGGGPPDLFFLIPVSQNVAWWPDISLELSLMGINVLTQNSNSITLQQFDPHNAENSVTFTINKTNGALINYNLNITMAVPSTGLGFTGSFMLQLNFIKGYEMSTLNPTFAISSGKQYRYLIDTLNINGSTSTPVIVGTFQQGQNLDILFNSFSLANGPSTLITLSTTTGQTTNNITYNIFQHQDGPILFFPVLPVSSNPQMLNFFGDVFHYIGGAIITDNATVFGLSIGSFETPDMLINHLNIFWNKTNGLMISYDLDAVNPNNSSQVMKLKLSFVGESTGQNLYTSTPTTTTTTTTTATTATNSTSTTSTGGSTATISTPSFDFVILFFALIPVLIIRKRKNN